MDVVLKLTPLGHGEEENHRMIKLSDRGEVKVGRVSKNQNKGMLAAPNNAWFDYPTISRTHAKFTAFSSVRDVCVQDCDSTHGTFLGKQEINPGVDYSVDNGQTITFGKKIIRNGGSSREGSVQVLDSHPRTYSVPSIDLETESEDEDEDEEDEDVDSASAVTTLEQVVSGKDHGTKIIEVDSLEKSSANTGVRGLSLKGPRLEEILSKPAALGTSQLNPIDLEGAPPFISYDISDTESEDDGPEILPISQKVSKDKETNDWSEPKLARPQFHMPTVEDDAADRAADTLVKRIILETQARNDKEREPTGSESPELATESVTGATDGLDTEDDDGFSQDEDFSDYSDNETEVSKAESPNPQSDSLSGSNPKLFPLNPATDDELPCSQAPSKASAPDRRPIRFFEPATRSSDPTGVPPTDQDGLTILSAPLSAIQRPPSPSDAALVKKASDPKRNRTQFFHEQPSHAIVPKTSRSPTFERLFTAPVGIAPYKTVHQEVTGWPECQQVSYARPYDQGPFSRHDKAVMPQRQSSLATANLSALVAEDDFDPYNGWDFEMVPSLNTTMTDNRSPSKFEPHKENEGQSSKINISSLVNTYCTEHPHSSKRKADEISSSNEAEESIFASLPPQPSASHTQAPTQPPPPSPYAAQSDENDTHMPDAQPRDILPQVEAATLTQDSIAEPVTSFTSITVNTKDVKTDGGPARKKMRTSVSPSGGIGKFVSGVAVGLVGAFAAFVATIPASVREEALREMANGA
ncbi:hypothetical protein P7C71_g2411, partial [Lecanoromycetidae sp. Uapishka_2]